MVDRHHILAIKALLVEFLSGYPSLINAGDGTVDAYVRPVMTLHLEAVDAAIKRFVRGEVPGQNIGFAPNATEFYLEAQRQEGVFQSRTEVPTDLPALPEGFKRLPGGVVSYPVGAMPPPGWDRIVTGTSVNYGHGEIELGGLTRREAEVVGSLGGMTPDGKNFAHLTFQQMRDEIARYLPASPVAA